MTHLLELRVPHIVLAVLLCPLLASALCLLLAVTYHSDRAFRTNCRPRVDNLLPSLSTVMTELTPERYIWRWFIALHTVPRLVLAIMYSNRLVERLQALPPTRGSTLYRGLCPLLVALHWAENLAILGVSYVTMKENKRFHENMYQLFIVSSVGYMAILCLLGRVTGVTGVTGHTQHGITPMERKAARYRWRCLMVYLVSVVGCWYFHMRHETKCEPYMHSVFAMCEYVLVAANMVYHTTAYWDFYDQSLYAVPGDDDKFN